MRASALALCLNLLFTLSPAHQRGVGSLAWAGTPFEVASERQSSAASVSSPDISPGIEESVLRRLKTAVRPGQPLVVSRLYNEVFTDPAERKVLDRLFNLFFKIPIYIVQDFEANKKPPSLQDISRQFRLNISGEADLLLTIMEADPRVPKFFRRDPKSGEIISIEPAVLRANPRFANQPERSLIGLEGQAAPDFTLAAFDGPPVTLSSLRGKRVLLYFWFTDCPPCVRISANLVALQRKYQGEKFTVLGLNADGALDLPYSNSDRAAYARRHQLNFPNVLLDANTLKAYGDVSIFPTLFLVSPDGIVQKQLINYQSLETLEKTVR